MKMEDNCFIFNTFLVYQLFLIILMYMSNFTLFIHGHHVILAKILFLQQFQFFVKKFAEILQSQTSLHFYSNNVSVRIKYQLKTEFCVKKDFQRNAESLRTRMRKTRRKTTSEKPSARMMRIVHWKLRVSMKNIALLKSLTLFSSKLVFYCKNAFWISYENCFSDRNKNEHAI